MSVTSSFGLMRIQAFNGMSFGEDAAITLFKIEPDPKEYPSSRPPPAATEAERKNRRETFLLLIARHLSRQLRRPPGKSPYAHAGRCRSDKGSRSSLRRCRRQLVSDSVRVSKRPTSSAPVDSIRTAELE